MTVRVSDLWVYPLKSAAGVRVERAELDAFGFYLDRRWMLTGADGRFLSQRQLPQMALLETALSGDRLTVRYQGEPEQPLVLSPSLFAEPCNVQIWEDRCEAWLGPDNAHRWFTQALSHPCRVVFMPDTTHRPVDPRYALEGDRASFSDGFPLLLVSEGSLSDLNGRLEKAVPMDRFRPNIVVTGCAPYEEDNWERLCVKGQGAPTVLDVVKPCSRCIITTTDQKTATRGLEPLRTLATYRRHNDKLMFGQNVIHRVRGEITVGDEVEIFSWRDKAE